MKKVVILAFLFMFFAVPVTSAADSSEVSENILAYVTLQETALPASDVEVDNTVTDPGTVGGPIFNIRDLRNKRINMNKIRKQERYYEYGIGRSDTGEDNQIIPDIVGEDGRPMHRLRGAVKAGRKEVRDARNEFRKERRSSLREFMNEKKSERKDFMKEKKEAIRSFRQGGMDLEEFKAERKSSRESFKAERKSKRQSLRTERKDARQEFKHEMYDEFGRFRGIFQKERFRMWRDSGDSGVKIEPSVSEVEDIEDADADGEEDDVEESEDIEDEDADGEEDDEEESEEIEEMDGTQSFFGSYFQEKIRKSNGRTGRGELRGLVETKRTRMGL